MHHYSILFYLIIYTSSISPSISSSIEYLRSITPAQVANITAQQFVDSYQAYKDYAWSCDALYPQLLQGEGCHNYYQYSNMWTPIDALDTMYLMGLDDLVTDTLQLLCNSTPAFTFKTDQNVPVFDYILRSLGGLLSAYHFINDTCLYDLALEVSDAIYPIFNEVTPSLSGLPWRYLNLHTGQVDKSRTDTSPAEAGTHTLEYGIMSVLSGDLKYWNASMNAMRILYDAKSAELGLIGIGIFVDDTADVQSTHFFRDTTASISSGIDSYYEYIVKCWALFNNTECRAWWLDVINSSVIDNLSYYNNYTGAPLLWFKHVDMHTGQDSGFDYDLYSPFYSGVLSLSTTLDPNDMNNKYNLKLAKLNQEANWYMWSKYNIEPYVYNFENDRVSVASYNLNPENFESNYYLYMITNDSVYYDRALMYLDDLMTYCKCDGIFNSSGTNCVGYTGLTDVIEKKRSNSQPSYWFAESLKYLYLTFMRNEVNNPLPFDQYVFNTEAHPYPKSWGYKLNEMLQKSSTSSPTTINPSIATTAHPSLIIIKPSNTTDNQTSKSHATKDTMIVIVVLCCALISAVLISYCYFVKRKRSRQAQSVNFRMLNSDVPSVNV